MDDELEQLEPPFVHNTQGPRSAFQMRVDVSHDLGDRTLILVVLLAVVIGFCGVTMGLNFAKQDALDDRARDLATKYQLMTNHTRDLEAHLNALEKKHEQ